MNQTIPSHYSSQCSSTNKTPNHSQIRTIRKKPDKISSPGTSLRFYCAFPACISSFRRSSDLVRHEKSIHGPKQACKHQGCKYSTGRLDKLNEHTRKVHKTAAAPRTPSYIPTPVLYTSDEPSIPYTPFDTSKLCTPYAATPDELCTPYAATPATSSPASYTPNNSLNIFTPTEWKLETGVSAEDAFMECQIYSDFRTPFYADTWSLAPIQSSVAPSWDIPPEWFH